MPAYEIRWSRKAFSYLKRLDSENRKRIVEAVETLAADSENPSLDIKPLHGRPGEFRLRVGAYRVIYETGSRRFAYQRSHCQPLRRRIQKISQIHPPWLF